MSLNFSKYSELYDLLIEKNNFWKQLNDMVDFSFVVDKYFLGYNPEETELIDSSLLTVFRRERLKMKMKA